MNKSEMLTDLMRALGFSKKVDFAAHLNISGQQLSNWFNRKTFDPEILFSKCPGINPIWIFTNNGSIFLKNNIKEGKYYGVQEKPLSYPEEGENSNFENVFVKMLLNNDNFKSGLLKIILSKTQESEDEVELRGAVLAKLLLDFEDVKENLAKIEKKVTIH